MPSPWDSRIAATFGVRRAQVEKAATWASDAVDAVVRRHWARLTRLAREGGTFQHVYTLSREIVGQMNADVQATVTQRLYGAADWSFSTAVDAMLNGLPTQAYLWLVAETLFGSNQLREQIAWPPKLTKAQKRNLDFEARAIGFQTVDEYLDSLLRLLPSDMAEDERRSTLIGLIRDSHGKLPPDRVTGYQRPGKPATIVLGRPDSLSAWWASGFHKLSRAEQQTILKQFVFDPPTKQQIKAIVEKRTAFGGKPPMSYHERLEMLSHTITDKDQLARKFAASVAAGDLPRDTMLAILPQVNGGKVSAQRIARTELARVANGLAEETFDRCADVIAGYQIHEVMDVVTRPHHAARNGKIWYVNGNPPAEERPTLPDEWNCRGWYSPVLTEPESVRKTPELLKAYRDNAGPIQDPLVYSQWWDRASDEERRVVVGSRRYDAVAQKIAGVGKPKFEDFVDPQSGELIKTDQLRGEDLAAFAARRQANAEAFQQRAALLRQTAEKSFLDVPRGGGNSPPPIKPVKPPPAPKPPRKPKAKPVKPVKPKAKKPKSPANTVVAPTLTPGVTFTVAYNPRDPLHRLGESVRKKIGNGIRDEAHAREVGEMLVQPVKAAIEKAWKSREMKAADKAASAALKAHRIAGRKGASIPDLDKMEAEYRKKAEYAEWLKQELRAEAVVKVLSSVRDMGPKAKQDYALGTPHAVEDALDSAAKAFPSDWLEKSRNHGRIDGLWANSPRARYSADDRGYHIASLGEIAIPSTMGRLMTDQTAIHELTHRMEYLVPRLKELEKQLYDRRTAGEQLKPIDPSMPGELARHDKWIHSYMGKENASGAFEILSMATEAVFKGAYQIEADLEVYRFTLGVLAGI